MIKKYVAVHVHYLLFLSYFNANWFFSTVFKKILELQISLKSLKWEQKSSMWTYVHDEANSRFSPGKTSAHKNVSLPSALLCCKWNWSVHVYGTNLM